MRGCGERGWESRVLLGHKLPSLAEPLQLVASMAGPLRGGEWGGGEQGSQRQLQSQAGTWTEGGHCSGPLVNENSSGSLASCKQWVGEEELRSVLAALSAGSGPASGAASTVQQHVVGSGCRTCCLHAWGSHVQAILGIQVPTLLVWQQRVQGAPPCVWRVLHGLGAAGWRVPVSACIAGFGTATQPVLQHPLLVAQGVWPTPDDERRSSGHPQWRGRHHASSKDRVLQVMLVALGAITSWATTMLEGYSWQCVCRRAPKAPQV
jgi:hypothetical protein